VVAGIVPIRKVNGNEVGGNVIVFQDIDAWNSDKPPEYGNGGGNVLALTTLFYDPGTGQIRSYALEMKLKMSESAYTFDILDQAGGHGIDLANTLTHELGHVMALDHSDVRDSTMFSTAPPGETSKRILATDDTNGLCTLYSQKYAEVNPDEGLGENGGGGCQAGGRTSSAALLPALLGLAGLAIAARRRRAAPLMLVALLLISIPAGAQEAAIDLATNSRVLMGSDKPTATIKALRPLQGVTVTLRLPDGRAKTVAVGLMKMGQSKIIPLPDDPGRMTITLEVSSKSMKEPEAYEIPVVVARPMKIDVTKDTVDLADGRITFTASEPVAKVTMTVLGEEGRVLTDATEDRQAAAGTPITVRFPTNRGAITLLRLTATDPDGFFNGVEMAPFFVEVPHEEVNFDSAKSDIMAAEEPKLARTLDGIHAALLKFGNELKAKLYVAGYTDTVGSRDYNQDLSSRRALAIASWFQAHGMKVRACWQGFGEDALSIQTADETDEARNRRTIHVLASQPPPASKTFPRNAWKCL
jgi:outer membrane protein OmpA-like peptidoglycan-associated protein